MNAANIEGLIRVPVHALGRIRAGLAKCHASDVRHAARLGLETPAAPELAVVATTAIRECGACRVHSTDADQWLSVCCNVPARRIEMADVTLSCTRPLAGSWELLAVVEGQPKDFEGKASPNLIRRVPGSTEGLNLDAWRWGDARNCDHCTVARRRDETFLVMHVDTREIKQVGRNCLEGFLGGQSYESLVRRLGWHEVLLGGGEDDGEGGGWGSWGKPPADIETVMALTACVIRNDGWLSKSKAEAMVPRGQSTSDQVESLIYPPHHPTLIAEWRKEVARLAPQERDMEHGRAALAWVRDLEPRDDYEWSIRTAGRLTHVEKFGIACSIVSAYDRVLGREMKRKARIAGATDADGNPTTKHGGAVGEKITVTGICERASTIDNGGQWGPTTSITIVSPEGVVVQWWKSGTLDEVIFGRTVTITGRVKSLDEYEGRQITTLTRCKFTVAPDAADELAAVAS